MALWDTTANQLFPATNQHYDNCSTTVEQVLKSKQVQCILNSSYYSVAGFCETCLAASNTSTPNEKLAIAVEIKL